MRWSSAAGSGPGKATGQEGELRASAVVIEDDHGGKVALVACDVLMVERDVLDRAARRIEQATGIPFDHILINATHTHHAPTTATIHGYAREEAFTRQVEDKIVQAADQGRTAGSVRPRSCSGSARSRRSARTAGCCSATARSTGSAATTTPCGRPARSIPSCRSWPSAAPDGGLEAVLFNHSTHTIGTHKPGVRSPSFYGLAAQALEKERGGTFLFFEGASGSTHNLDVPTPEATHRIQAGGRRGPSMPPRPRPVDRVRGLRKEITVKVRHFDEAADERAVTAYCTKRIKDPAAAQKVIETFRAMRRQVAPRQGQARKTWVQAILIGDVAIVGVPGEFFTVLGQEIKRRSPFRYTYVFELANDYIGYIPDRQGFDRGGYQVWTGLHSFLERGPASRSSRRPSSCSSGSDPSVGRSGS